MNSLARGISSSALTVCSGSACFCLQCRVFIKLNTLSTEAVLVGIKRDNRVSLCIHGKVAWRAGSSTNAVKRSLLGCLCLKINLIKDNVVTNFDSNLDSNNI